MNENLKKIKKNLTPGVIIMLVCGFVLLTLSFSGEGGKSTSVRTESISRLYDDEETEEEQYYENRLKETLESMNGVGRAEVFIAPEMTGVCILCEGADDYKVKEQIINVCQSLFDMPVHKIQIYRLKA